MKILFDSLRATLKKVPQCKMLGEVGIHHFWFKQFTSIHNRQAMEKKRCLNETDILKWITKGKTMQIKEITQKENILNNYRTITCLQMLWKIVTVQIKEMYHSLVNRELFLGEQKKYHKGTRGTENILYIEKYIFKERKTR